MPIRIASLQDIEPTRLPGRDLQWLVTPETIGVQGLSACVMTCQPHAVVKPLHAHAGIEEVIYILKGQGEASVSGERAAFKQGDAVLFPANAPHQVRNTGDDVMVVVCMFSAPTDPSSYVNYDRDVFAE
ncbi:MAG TPA: cupin domain-containing protein [Anaerolineae bacterium]